MFRLQNESRLDCEWAMTHLWMTKAELAGELRLAYWWVMSRLWTSHVSIMNQSNCGSRIGGKVKTCLWKSLACGCIKSRAYKWAMSMKGGGKIGGRVESHSWVRHMSHSWMSHVSPMNESCFVYEWVMSHLWISHTGEWVMSHSWMSHASLMVDSHSTISCVSLMNGSGKIGGRDEN